METVSVKISFYKRKGVHTMREEYVLHRVTELRNERRWSLYRLAKEAGVSYSTLNNSFRRNNVPSVPTLMRICDGFGITLSEFFDESGSVPEQMTAADQLLLGGFHRLPRSDRNLLTAYMQGLLKITGTREDGSEVVR